MIVFCWTLLVNLVYTILYCSLFSSFNAQYNKSHLKYNISQNTSIELWVPVRSQIWGTYFLTPIGVCSKFEKSNFEQTPYFQEQNCIFNFLFYHIEKISLNIFFRNLLSDLSLILTATKTVSNITFDKWIMNFHYLSFKGFKVFFLS